MDIVFGQAADGRCYPEFPGGGQGAVGSCVVGLSGLVDILETQLGLRAPIISTVTRIAASHHTALPWSDMPAFITKLRQRQGIAALATEFLILTAARSGEVRGAVWDEFDLSRNIWTVPAVRMKAGREHRVPLVPRAVEILHTAKTLPGEAFVFPGQRSRSSLSDMSLTAVLRRMKVNTTIHGFRSSFKDWAHEATAFPNDLSEAALAHVWGDATERAYRRSDALDRRRELMEDWARFCNTDAASNIVQLWKTTVAAK